MLALWQFSDIRQFRIVQKTLYDLKVRLVVRRPLTEEIRAEVTRRIKSALSEHFLVSFTYHRSIPLPPSGKFRDVVCEVNPADAPTPPCG